MILLLLLLLLWTFVEVVVQGIQGNRLEMEMRSLK
jgi:hypothetical protein